MVYLRTFRDDAQRAFGANEQFRRVEACGRFSRSAASLDDLAGGQDHGLQKDQRGLHDEFIPDVHTTFKNHSLFAVP